MNEEKNAKNVAKPEVSLVNADIRTVVFDMDGTLYDKTGLARRLVARLWWCLPLLAAERLARRNAHYVQFASEEEFFDFFFVTMARGHWWGTRLAARWYHSVYLPTMVRLIRRHHKPRPQAMEIIEECRKRGLKMAIYSDYGSVMDKLDALHIDPKLFDLIVSAPQFGALKPSEPCVRRVLELLEADPKTTLFVGDRDDKDGASARAVGARFYQI